MLPRAPQLRLILSLVVVATNACSPPPDPAAVEALTTGVWHAHVPEDPSRTRTHQEGGDFVYEIRFENGAFSGRAHQVIDGRHRTELPITGLSLDGRAIEIRSGSFPPYRGEADLEGGRIEGGIGKGLYKEMNLTRVAAAEWPMIRLREVPTAGESTPAGSRPAALDGGWPTAATSAVGIDPAAVEATVRAILAGEAGAIHAFLVARDGSLVVEEYFHGWGAEDLHQFASCTKSVSSLLVGIAIDRGLLSGVDVPVLDFFPGYAEGAGRGWEAVRLEHLLTMTVGLDWAEDERLWLPPPGVDRFADILRRDVAVTPGTRWRYVDRNMSLLPGVLRRATGVDADAFAAEHLFAPLGITAWDWETKRWQGHPDMVGSLELRPRDMAKLGQLVLDEGRWQGRRVISAEWIRESTRAHVAETYDDLKYGYLWWRMATPLGDSIMAQGTGSHFILVIPDARMVIVTTAGNQFNGRSQAILRLVDQHLAHV